ncbi:uncharacterized protein LOC132907131 [Bombus pascuorum]|uniref:uncharacterized protein LOC132907131 n=1 Tax=Bombus pascuorum TaxID=65598 RepID=UPI00298ECB75|nr:uncharacterized protein LOC132907131 [Bombus pascuorum]
MNISMYYDLKNWSIFSLLESKFISNVRMAIVYGKAANETLIVTKDDMVYGIGNNTYGCLGTGDTHSTIHPKKIEALCGKGVKTIAYGKGPHVLALTEEGKVYSWGYNDYCELGNRSTNECLTPTLISSVLNDVFVVDIACGGHHSLALTSKGEIYAWGHNVSGQVGCGTILSTVQPIPKLLHIALNGKKVVHISCGDSSSVAVMDNGEVYSWGHNGVGQLGIGNCTSQVEPQKVTTFAKIVIEKVVCGYMHTLALSDEGVLYVWGANSYGQLGLNTDSNVWTPRKLQIPEMGRILDIATSHYHHISLAMCEGNRIFMWGQCLGQSIKVPILTPLKCLYDALAYYAFPPVMHQPLIFHNDEEANIANSLRNAFDDPTTSDLVIQVHGKPIHVHKAVLKIRCHYFRTMFQEHWVENSQSIIEHEQFSYDVYKTFLKYLYTNEVDLSQENALELLDLANVYSENQLKRHCIQMINRKITVTNVAYLYSISIQYSAKELEEYCFKFALNHMTAVVQTEDFAKLDESTMKTFIVRAAQAGIFKTYFLDSNHVSKIHMALVYGDLGNEALIITRDKIVYALGSNTSGCLGTGDACNTFYPKKVEALCGKDIKTFAYGKGPHVLALTEEGKVYSWGHNSHGELGNCSTNHMIPMPVTRNLNDEFIVDIACGSHHSLALTNEGKVYAWGENTSGQVGKSVNINENTPMKVNSTLASKTVICISCCQSSSMTVTDTGKVYGWGCNDVGQLGIGNYVNQVDPCKVTMLIGVVIEKIVCGYAHVLALSNKGALYVWGGNNYGQLGLGMKTNICSPVQLKQEVMGRVLDVATSHYNHISIAMAEGNRIFMWGECLGQSITLPVLTNLGSLHDVFARYASPSVMHQPLVLHNEEPDVSLIDCFREAFNDQTTSDLVIQVRKKFIYVHKAILVIRSQYFRTMFQETLTANNQSVIKQQKFSYDVYKAYLKYLYTDEIDLPLESILELLKLAVAYSENQLKNRCIQIIRRGITVENAAFCYSIAIDYNAKESEEYCFKFALNHMTAVVQTASFAKLDEYTMKTFIIKAANAGAFKT